MAKVIIRNAEHLKGILTNGKEYDILMDKGHKIMLMSNQGENYWIMENYFDRVIEQYDIPATITESVVEEFGKPVETTVEEIRVEDVMSERESDNSDTKRKYKRKKRVSDDEITEELDRDTIEEDDENGAS